MFFLSSSWFVSLFSDLVIAPNIEVQDLVHIGRLPREEGGKISVYPLGGGALFGTFFSGVSERGGVFEVDVRLPRGILGSHDDSCSCMALLCFFVWTIYHMPLRSIAIATRMRD
jgi:hypothetical protein